MACSSRRMNRCDVRKEGSRSEIKTSSNGSEYKPLKIAMRWRDYATCWEQLIKGTVWRLHRRNFKRYMTVIRVGGLKNHIYFKRYVTDGSYNVSNISGDAVILYTRKDVLSVRWMHKYLVNYLSVFMGPYIKPKPNAGPSSMISNRKMCLLSKCFSFTYYAQVELKEMFSARTRAYM